MVKPVHETCSIGITSNSVVQGPAEANARVEHIWKAYGQAALVEAFVPGFDIEVPLGQGGTKLRGPVGSIADDRTGKKRPWP